MTTTAFKPLNLNGTAYGGVLIVATLATIALVAHHPPQWLLAPADAAAIAADTMGRVEHGVFILLTLLLMTGASGLAWRIGIAHPLVMAGWLAYVGGGLSLIGALLLNGYIAPGLPGDALPPAVTALAAVSRLGLVLLSLGVVLWGHALLHRGGAARMMALLGMAAGGFSAAFVLTAGPVLDLDHLMAWAAAHIVWNLAIGVWFLRSLKHD
ncbi:hypothetical protein [Asticcacaulis solisilvae]|uniref:hypothetical protein n=1 Tax=Asticcacaulis solisilvae TaxID=1217274 RepID=UPI003FD7B962